MNLLRHAMLLFALLLCSTSILNAQATPTPTPTPSVKAVSTFTYTNNKWCDQQTEKLCEAGIGDRIIVEVDGLSTAVGKNEISPADLVVFLNGRPFKGVSGFPVEDPKHNRVAFDLKRTDDSKAAWTALLGSPSFASPYREVTVSVGRPDKEPFPFSDAKQAPKIRLRAYYQDWLYGAFIFLLTAVGVFIYLAKTKNIIRDSGPPEPPQGSKRPYSLALTQAAVWFFLVVGSFLFIYLVTGDYNTITEQALILIGIGTGTALGAAMINATKSDTADTQLSGLEPTRAKLEEERKQLQDKAAALVNAATQQEKQDLADASAALKEVEAKLLDVTNKIEVAKSGLSKPVSEGFAKDLMTDANGVSLHRFQMVIWTIVLGTLFVIGVYQELAMPAFSGTLLALMGISSGTYLGFKIPEKQT
jgi:hypothetical protein